MLLEQCRNAFLLDSQFLFVCENLDNLSHKGENVTYLLDQRCWNLKGEVSCLDIKQCETAGLHWESETKNILTYTFRMEQHEFTNPRNAHTQLCNQSISWSIIGNPQVLEACWPKTFDWLLYSNRLSISIDVLCLIANQMFICI